MIQQANRITYMIKLYDDLDKKAYIYIHGRIEKHPHFLKSVNNLT